MLKNLFRKVRGSKLPSTVGTFNEKNRVNWLESTLRKIPEGSRILDAGAGEQPFKRLCSHLNYVSQDFGKYKPEELDQGLQMGAWDYGKLDIVSDIASIPEKDNSFDAIMCTEVLEHIVNPREAIREFARLLRKDGYLILTAPFCSLTHFAPYHFYSGFNTFFYSKELADNGFKIVEMRPNGNFFEYLAQELRRIPAMAEKFSLSSLTRTENETVENALVILERLSKDDKGSSELLCFGFHVFARKI